VQRRWPSWRGKAVEPLARQSLEIACASGATPWPDVQEVGANRIYFLGSIKWLGTPFDRHDLADLLRGAAEVPGFTLGTSGLAIVSLSGTAPGVRPGQVDLEWGPDDIVSAWQSAT